MSFSFKDLEAQTELEARLKEQYPSHHWIASWESTHQDYPEIWDVTHGEAKCLKCGSTATYIYMGSVYFQDSWKVYSKSGKSQVRGYSCEAAIMESALE